jgi:hypothetical protein
VLNAFSHYLLGQYDATLSWAREELYVNPNHLQALTVRAAAQPNWDGPPRRPRRRFCSPNIERRSNGI